MKLKRIIKKGLKNVISYFVSNRLFVSYVILAIFSSTLLRHFTIGNTWAIQPFIIDLSLILIVGSLGYLFKPKKQFVFYFTCLIVISLVTVVNSVYYTFYMSYATFGLLSSFGQAGEVGDSIAEKLEIHHFIFLLAPIVLFFINKLLGKKNYYNYTAKTEKKKKMIANTIIVSLAMLAIIATTLTGPDYSKLSKQWNREYVVKKYGIILYQTNDLIQSLTPKINALFGYDEAARHFRDYYTNRFEDNSNNQYTNVFEGKNIIFVHMESIQSFTLDLKVNGKEVTPNLNLLKEQGIFFSNFYPQVGVGTSSDTEFTLATSLMPALSGTVFVSYNDREYETIYKLLKERNYYTFSMHANKAEMWNRNVMHPSLGYDTFYSKTSYIIPLEEDDPEWIGFGLSDKEFFKQSIPMLENIEQTNTNYLGTIITLSNHSPFEELDKYGEFDLTENVIRYDEKNKEYVQIADSYLEESKMGNYLKSTHYADQALGNFINYVNDSAYFNNTVFIFYGDHDARLAKEEFNNLYNYNVDTGQLLDELDPNYYNYDYYQQQLDKKVPLIIWTKDQAIKSTYDYPMGMIDIMPTLANMMNFKCTYCLGNDIFNIKYNNTVVFTNGNYLTNKIYYNNSKDEYISLNYSPIDESYVRSKKDYADNMLTLSNNIIVHDLIKKESSNIGGQK